MQKAARDNGLASHEIVPRTSKVIMAFQSWPLIQGERHSPGTTALDSVKQGIVGESVPFLWDKLGPWTSMGHQPLSVSKCLTLKKWLLYAFVDVFLRKLNRCALMASWHAMVLLHGSSLIFGAQGAIWTKDGSCAEGFHGNCQLACTCREADYIS